MNSLIAWWARNSVAANLVMVGVFVAGTIGFSKMEREIDPQVRFPGLQIVVSWPGAAPQEVEEQIVARIEESVSESPSVIWMLLNGFVPLRAKAAVRFTSWPSNRLISPSS